MMLSLKGPAGVIADTEVLLERTQAQYFRATGKTASQPWATGTYMANVQIIRNGTTVSEMTHQIVVTP